MLGLALERVLSCVPHITVTFSFPFGMSTPSQLKFIFDEGKSVLKVGMRTGWRENRREGN